MLSYSYIDNNNRDFLKVNRLFYTKKDNNLATTRKDVKCVILQPKGERSSSDSTKHRRKYNVSHRQYRLAQAIGYNTKGKQRHVVQEEFTLIEICLEMKKANVEWRREEIIRRYKFKVNKVLSERDLYNINHYISNLQRIYFLIRKHEKHNTTYGKDYSILLTNSEILKGGEPRGPKELSLPVSDKNIELFTHDNILFLLKQRKWTNRKKELFEMTKIFHKISKDFNLIRKTIKTDGTINPKFKIAWFKHLEKGKKLLRGNKEIKKLYIEACQISKKLKITNPELTLDKLKEGLFRIRKLGNGIDWLITQEKKKYEKKYLKKNITPERVEEVKIFKKLKEHIWQIARKKYEEKYARIDAEHIEEGLTKSRERHLKQQESIKTYLEEKPTQTREMLIQQFWTLHIRKTQNNINNLETLSNPNQITKEEIENFLFQERQKKIYLFWKLELQEDINNLTIVENRDNITKKEIEKFLENK